MPKITVTSKIGNTYHPKYGLLVKGQELTIDEEDFGDQIFQRKKINAGEGAAPPAVDYSLGSNAREDRTTTVAPAQAGTKTTKPRRY